MTALRTYRLHAKEFQLEGSIQLCFRIKEQGIVILKAVSIVWSEASVERSYQSKRAAHLDTRARDGVLSNAVSARLENVWKCFDRSRLIYV